MQYNELARVAGTTTQTVVATGAGRLVNVNLNSMVGTTAVTIGSVTTILGTNSMVGTHEFDCRFNGTLAVTLGSASNDVTVTWSR